MSAAFVDYYALLGVDSTATKGEIVTAYRRAALQRHPDKHPAENFAEANADFRQYAEAKDTLTNRCRRYAYDLLYMSHIREQERKSASVPTEGETDYQGDDDYYNQFDIPDDDYFRHFEAPVQPPVAYHSYETPPCNWRFNPQPPSGYGSATYVPKVVQGKSRAGKMKKRPHA